jgi:hypothetical protein
MGQQMAKTMWATLASLMTFFFSLVFFFHFFFFFWLSPLKSLGFKHTLKPRKKKKKKRSDAPPEEALEANWLLFSFFFSSDYNNVGLPTYYISLIAVSSTVGKTSLTKMRFRISNGLFIIKGLFAIFF